MPSSRRLAEGKSSREIQRCLKRHVARRPSKLLETGPSAAQLPAAALGNRRSRHLQIQGLPAYRSISTVGEVGIHRVDGATFRRHASHFFQRFLVGFRDSAYLEARRMVERGCRTSRRLTVSQPAIGSVSVALGVAADTSWFYRGRRDRRNTSPADGDQRYALPPRGFVSIIGNSYTWASTSRWNRPLERVDEGQCHGRSGC